MPSNDSSPDEHPSLSEDCTTCGHVYNWHMSHGARKCTAASGECGCSGFTMEPKGSASSSPDEPPLCQCGHPPASHDKLKRHLCIGNRNLCGCPEYVPADAETAGEPECSHESWEERNPSYAKDRVSRYCNDCDEYLGRFAPTLFEGEASEPEAVVCTHDHWDEGFMRCRDCGFEPESPGSPRPPFLVAYATGSGALNELALPGDATVAVLDGSLVISHASGVLGIQHVRPLES